MAQLNIDTKYQYPQGVWVATVKGLPGVECKGDTREEATKRMREVATILIGGTSTPPKEDYCPEPRSMDKILEDTSILVQTCESMMEQFKREIEENGRVYDDSVGDWKQLIFERVVELVYTGRFWDWISSHQ